MTLRERLANQRRKRDRAAHNFDSNTAKIKTLTAQLARRPKLGIFLADRFDLRITSTYRTPQHNKNVGGVPNSWHTKGRGRTIVQKLRRPAATDLVGAEFAMAAASRWVAEHVPGIDENFVHDVGSGRHLHLGGWAVADWDWPESGRLKRTRARRRRNLLNRALFQSRIDAIKKLLLEQPVPAKGFDVSNHQARVDFRAAKASGWDFVWLRAGEGATGPTADPGDPVFLRRVAEAKAAGLKVGAYWFLHPKTTRSGAEEARAFHKRIVQARLGAGDLVPVLDIEVKDGLTDAQVRQYAVEAYDELRRLTGGRKVAIYSFVFFLSRWPLKFARAPLWIADFRGLPAPGIPAPWSKAAAWQWTSKGREPWVSGDLDKNKTDDLRKLIA